MEKMEIIDYNGGMVKKKSPPEFDLAAFCRDVRAEEDCSQREMAEKLGVAKSTYESWEAGNFEPNGQAVIKLLKIRAARRGININAFLS
jgi:DNA-binding XRE family transcriptional regulator